MKKKDSQKWYFENALFVRMNWGGITLLDWCENGKLNEDQIRLTQLLYCLNKIILLYKVAFRKNNINLFRSHRFTTIIGL
ncbi:MAG: hypothetical protein ABIO76_01840 [Ginsengibacter sp.]